jgi:hypothetical protein
LKTLETLENKPENLENTCPLNPMP